MNKKKIIVMFIVGILAVGGVAGGLYLNQKNKQNINPSGLSGYILGEGVDPTLTMEEIETLLQKKVDESKVAFTMYTQPTFDGKKGTIMFANPRYSAHDMNLVVTCDDKTIIRTEKISPNQYIEEIELLGRGLKKGEHAAEAMITAYNRETGEVVGNVAVDMTIFVK